MTPSAAAAPPLSVEGLRFGWGKGPQALQDCRLEIPGPGLWMLVGSNGSGKSTLLRLIAGLLTPEAGRISCPCKPALVFQNPDHQLLLPSCGSDLQLALPEDLSAAERAERVARALAQVGLPGLERRPIHTLSGGQKQRLAIAGALASAATLLLLDEPTALLDPDSQREVLELIHQLCHRSDAPLTALWITHRLEELRRCDGAARMESGRIGPWQSGAALRRSLAHLPAGGAER
ncbi:ABC transporter ATP-binding protein [Synechococcus sp. CCY 9618]|uniref:ABC transporter ATP-binding protein n=1 Tax=Synechococcus sp. CCY 9618 TaxID=2815602 RepID=UPI001C243BE1|nr:ABC transporter ATP-binding protein [Synechococcus sp. CCY 9618]